MVDCDRFPGIEFKDDVPGWHGCSRIFSTWQGESKVLDCLKYSLSDIMDKRCLCVVVKRGEHWWNCDKYYSGDQAVSALFGDSLSKYITKFDIDRSIDSNTFKLWIKLKEIGDSGVSTNIGPDLLEYIASLFKT